MDLPKATLTVSMHSFPSDRIVGAISRLVYEFCRALIHDTDMAERFYMAAQELAENLVKYSSGSEVSLSAELLGVEGDAVLQLRARNHSTPDQLRAVEAKLRELTGASDPIELYDRLIRESAPHADRSGLGLARIRAEGEFDLDYAIDGDELTICVRASVHPQATLEES